MFKYSQLNYDRFYSSEQCKQENTSIKKLLDCDCCRGDTVIDLGAGTGLVSALIGYKCHVYQVEVDADMKKQNKYPNFVVSDALDYLRCMKNKCADVVTSVFSANYMPLRVIPEAARVSRRLCIFVVYHKPYLWGSASFYAGRQGLYLWKHWLKSKLMEVEFRKLRKRGYNVRKFPLLGQPYYDVYIVRR